MTVKLYFEPLVEPIFHPDSYGYRPGKSAIDAVRVTRTRCWRHDWVLEFDIKGLFDNIDHELLMKAVKKHTDCPWIILYIERWLTAPFQMKNGDKVERTSGTPQGCVISPVLANLFMHYTFDKWMAKEQPQNPWARYADDAVIHCRTQEDAERLLERLRERFKQCKLELHPEKTRIIYCKDKDRKGDYPEIKFDFLGYTFRPRKSKNRHGEFFINFTPAVSNKACKAMRQTIRGWRMHLKPDIEIDDLSRMYNAVIRGWINYYGHFYKSQLYSVLRHMDLALIHWARRKYKKLERHKTRAIRWMGRLARNLPHLFAHWQMGILPATG
jgi:RNA-directed DNA polymerase